ncbi:MAG: hypothetical protein KME29_12180 [Calothrix sp. FI2-JRJ7]|jgi:hypothetical protein|nr:hypothetical protein [Calothrix sp. FI2-JRJ7]
MKTKEFAQLLKTEVKPRYRLRWQGFCQHQRDLLILGFLPHPKGVNIYEHRYW